MKSEARLQMNFKAFGNGGPNITEIGMGTYYDPLWILTARSIRWMRGASAKVEALKAGLDGGINLIDTAELYGSEPLVARAIKGRKREMSYSSLQRYGPTTCGGTRSCAPSRRA